MDGKIDALKHLKPLIPHGVRFVQAGYLNHAMTRFALQFSSPAIGSLYQVFTAFLTQEIW
jgi:hypothetical protein